MTQTSESNNLGQTTQVVLNKCIINFFFCYLKLKHGSNICRDMHMHYHIYADKPCLIHAVSYICSVTYICCVTRGATYMQHNFYADEEQSHFNINENLLNIFIVVHFCIPKQ